MTNKRRPPLKVNEMLENYICVNGVPYGLDRKILLKTWKKLHEQETGYKLADPKGSFYHAVKGCLRRIEKKSIQSLSDPHNLKFSDVSSEDYERLVITATGKVGINS